MVYYLNHEEIGRKQAFLRWLAGTADQLVSAAGARGTVQALAEERVLHLAIECVTDLGNLLIDGFMMRDPSSYEDIVEILNTEEVTERATAAGLIELVRCRKALLQEYADWDRKARHPLLAGLPELLTGFAEQTERYVEANRL